MAVTTVLICKDLSNITKSEEIKCTVLYLKKLKLAWKKLEIWKLKISNIQGYSPNVFL